MKSSLSLIILEDVYTKQDAYVLLDSLMQLEKFLYSTKINIASKLGELFSEKKTKAITDFLKKEKIDLKNPQVLVKTLAGVKQTIKDMSVIQIQLAIAPTEEILASIVKWFEKNGKRKSLLDIQVNKALIGGLIISKQGLYKDYSVKREFENKFRNTKP